MRVPLNEACWNAESYVNPAYAGANYINAIKSYVSLLNANGIVAILDLHWTDGAYTGNVRRLLVGAGHLPEADAGRGPGDPVLDVGGEHLQGQRRGHLRPVQRAVRVAGHGSTGRRAGSAGETAAPAPASRYPVAGMQQMVNAVRSTGANNVLMLGGEEYSNDLTQLAAAYEPTDPDHNLVASWHSYNFNTCSTQSCWTVAGRAGHRAVPVIAGEIGENDCAGTLHQPADDAGWSRQNTSYLAWAWNADFNCSSGPGLITDYTGTPTNYGAAYKAILQALPAGEALGAALPSALPTLGPAALPGQAVHPPGRAFSSRIAGQSGETAARAPIQAP